MAAVLAEARKVAVEVLKKDPGLKDKKYAKLREMIEQIPRR